MSAEVLLEVTADDLREHLLAEHPSVDVPWFTGSGWINQMTLVQLERLHDATHQCRADEPRDVDAEVATLLAARRRDPRAELIEEKERLAEMSRRSA